MNQSETKLFQEVMATNRELVTIVGQLLSELQRERSLHSRVSGPRIIRRDTPSCLDREHSDAERDLLAPLGFDASAVPVGPGSLLLSDLELDLDRREPGPLDPARADADRDADVFRSGVDGLPVDPDRDGAGRDRGLHGAGGPGAGPEQGDHSGDTLEPGGGDTGDDRGRVGNGDADTDDRADCLFRNDCGMYATWPESCPVCGDYEPTPAPVETRICAECGETKPISEFSKNLARGNVGGRRAYCKACGKVHRTAGRRRQAAEKKGRPEPWKVCTRCDQKKNLTEFGPYDGTIDRHDFLCHDCRALATAEREARATAGARGAATRAAAAAGGK